MNIFTIGYEGVSQEELIYALNSNYIQTLVDVRYIPLSRKPGFSKGALSAAVEAEGIEYRHMKALGCPSVIRDQYREDGDWSSYSRKFLRYIATQADAVEELYELATTSNCCLLCFERDVNRCHRMYVADRLVGMSGGLLERVDLRPYLETSVARVRNQTQESFAFL